MNRHSEMLGNFRCRWFTALVALVSMLWLVAAAQAWQPAGLDSLSITAIAVHPTMEGQIVVGTSGQGIYLTSNSGKDWEHVTKTETINCITYDFQSPSVIYAATSELGVLKSINGGRTFNPASNGLQELHVNSIAVDRGRSRISFAGTANGCFRSLDQGAMWQACGLEGQDVAGLAVGMLSGRPVVYAATRNGGIFKSDTNGSLWRPANEGLTSRSIRSLLTDPTIPGSLIAGTYDSGAFDTRDNGALWNLATTGMTITEGIAVVGAVGTAEEPGFWQYGSGFAKEIYFRRPHDGSWLKLGSVLPSGIQALGIRATHPAGLYIGTTRGLFVIGPSETRPPK